MVYNFFDKKSSGSGVDAEPNYALANEIHRQKDIVRKCKTRKAYLSFRGNIWGVDLADYAIIKQIQQRNQVFIMCN